jgi:hypothetical protein
MRIAATLLVLAACTEHSHTTPPIAHRVGPTACTPSAGDSFGSDECLVDTDCSNGGVCSCAGNTFEYAHATRNLCVAANCRTDADCGSEVCSPSDGDLGPFYGAQGYYCHTAADACGNDSDCGTDSSGRKGYCMFSAQVSHWTCAFNFAAG